MLSSTSELSLRVEKATNHLLIGPDWTLNMEICDLVNSNNSQAKDVLKAVKKRIQHKKPRVQFLALTLLETMIKNCGDFVHFQVAEREILQEMVKIVRKKTDMQVRDKVLLLLDSWQEAFGGPQGKYPQYYWAYAELKKSGVRFPSNSVASAPIFTPPVVQLVPGHPTVGYGMPINSSMRLDEAMASEIGNLSLTELNSIRMVMELLDDMLQAVNSNDRDAVKDEVIVDIITQCRSNQKKIIHFVSSTRNEELLAQALEVNDSLQYLIAKHDAIASGSLMPSRMSEPRRDLAPSASEIKSEKVSDEEDEDDGFAELARRNSKLKQHVSLSSSMGSCEQETSSNSIDATTGVTSLGKTEASTSTSTSSNALVVSDYPSPVSTSVKSKEQEIIDLLSLTLSDNPSSSSHTPMTPPSTLSLVPVSSQTQEYPQSQQPPDNPQPLQNFPQFPVNQPFVPYNNYVAPWAQQTVPQPMWQSQPQYQQQTSSYPLPPWATSSSSNVYNPFPVNHQQFTPRAYMAGNYVPTMNASRPLVKYNSFNSEANTPLASRPLQHQSSFGSRGNNSQGITGEMQQGTNIRPSVPATSSKPFIPSYRLFEDLIDLRNSDGILKAKNTASGLASSSNQSMINSRK